MPKHWEAYMKSIYTPNDYKDLATDSEMIQAAIDEAAKYGATVEIPRYNERTGAFAWNLDQTIYLHTGSHVVLDNCYIRLCDDRYIHFFSNSAAKDKIAVYQKRTRQYDISLIGRGNAVLDGGKPLDFCEGDFNIYDENGNYVKHVDIHGLTYMGENMALEFINVERITVGGIRFVNLRYWSMSFWFCSFGTVRDINIEALNNVPNQDGIDVRAGCNNFLIENINGLTGDDTVALTGLDQARMELSDMDSSIHHIIIRNIRARLTGECDIIRLLNRGGIKIYNVLIDGVMDLTDAYEEQRALAAIRIGDLCDYPCRLNELGEIRDIVVRNVMTRARFGAYVANTLADATFDNFRMYGDGGVGMYFNGCTVQNVTVRDFCYDITANAPDSDIGYGETFHRVKIDELNAIHFNNCTAENLVFDGLVTGKNLKHVFGGNSNLEVEARNVVMADCKTRLSSCAKVAER